jgi:hypothetical protein
MGKLAKPVAIVGCGRSGTQYMSLVFQQAGLDVGHERMGADGTVDASFGPRLDPEKYVVLHQVRQPIKVIANITIARESSWRRISQYIDLIRKPILRRALQVWIDWNKLNEAKARWTYRIEDIDQAWPKICDEIGIPHCPKALEGIPRNQHTRVGRYEPTTWEALMKLDPERVEIARDMARRYGYTEDYLTD